MSNCRSIPMRNPPSPRARRRIGSRRNKCAGAAAVIAAGVVGTGAAVVGVAGTMAGIADVAGAAATGVVAATTDKCPPGMARNEKSPARAGLCCALKRSESAAASIPPHGAVRAAAAGAYHNDRRRDDDRTRTNHNGPANRLAFAVGAASPARTASLRGFRRAEAGNGAQGQNCCEKVFHVFSRFRPQARHGPEPSHEHLNGT